MPLLFIVIVAEKVEPAVTEPGTLRETVAALLEAQKSDESIALLRRILRDTEASVRGRARKALRKLGLDFFNEGFVVGLDKGF